MTTTDPKLIERMLEGWPYDNIATGVPEHYLRAVVLPIVAAAINEAAQKERAGVVAWLRKVEAERTVSTTSAGGHGYDIGRKTSYAHAASMIERGEHTTPSGHAHDCDWHCDQHEPDCTCHLASPPAIEARKESQHG